ncbi:M24 family metallopeptidase [Paludibacterium yongneupense]|uniref:M24 family metallopeptidase n=1 Tax=Paludibacterium yongneupense TaxID=400061 RepID=UPI001FE4E756
MISEPEGFRYVTGMSQGVAGSFRRAGAGFALIPADPAEPIAVVVGDLNEEAFKHAASGFRVRSHPLWVETARIEEGERAIERAIADDWSASRPSGFKRPATFDLRCAIGELKVLLAQSGLAKARLGFDLDFVPAADWLLIRTALSGAMLLDGSPAFNRLRMVKTPAEIGRLRLGVELAEAGIRELQRSAAENQTARDLGRAFRSGVAHEAAARGVAPPPSWDYISIGPDPWRAGGKLTPGTLVKVDVGCVIDGYSSDSSRNFVFGSPSSAQARFHRLLEQAFDAGLSHVAPGQPLAAVHRAITRVLENGGLSGFSRGHFGHGLGQSLFSEQWPFISADSELLFEAGMVMALEVPIYVTGLGGFNIESQLLLTETGVEDMNTLPRQLLSLPAVPNA